VLLLLLLLMYWRV